MCAGQNDHSGLPVWVSGVGTNTHETFGAVADSRQHLSEAVEDAPSLAASSQEVLRPE